MSELGATYLGGGRCLFRVWAPAARAVAVCLVDTPGRAPVALEPVKRSYFEAVVDGVEPGARYLFRLDGEKRRPDPASRAQPDGVHGPSQVVAAQFDWGDGCWAGSPLPRYVIYELHPGTYTPEGTFDAIIPHLAALKDLGVTALEIMPVAQFPGERNWGYDGAYPFAAQSSYGGVDGFKRLVDACHGAGLAVVLDVVYNHLGPEGNYLWDYGPYFTDRYKTPWGAAVNFDGPDSDEVRRYFVENARYWIEGCHVDALRLDAVHALFDFSAAPFLAELAAEVDRLRVRLNRQIHLIAESDLNDPRLVRPRNAGGYGLDAQWSDDFHHALHVLLTGEHEGYYQDFGQLEQLAKALRETYVYSGEYSPFRKRRHGATPQGTPASRFIVCAQNHDQVGNRMLGERLSQLVSFESLKLAASLVLLSPFIPLLFMGEEYGETAPFLYFVSHTDRALAEAVRDGRREEFAAFARMGEAPDPNSEETFRRSILSHDWHENAAHARLREFYRELLRLRRDMPGGDQREVTVCKPEQALVDRRRQGDDEVLLLFSFAEGAQIAEIPVPRGEWRLCLDSADERWGGKGSAAPECIESRGAVVLPLAARGCVVYRRGG